MKHYIKCKSLLRLCLSVALLFLGQALSAADYIGSVTMNGIYYDLFSNEEGDRYAAVYYHGRKGQYFGDIRIPSSFYYEGVEYPVTEISDGAFSGCTGLTSVTLPDGLKKIGRYVFRGCIRLKSISIPKSVTQIGYDAFNEPQDFDDPSLADPGLETIIFEDGTDSLSGYWQTSNNTVFNAAIQLCESVKTLYLGRNVGITCLGDCKLEEVTVGSTVTELTSPNNSGLRVVNIKDASQPLHIGKGLFSKCRLESAYIGRDLEYDGTDGITPFAGNTELSSVTIGDCATSIGDSLFYGCTGLQSVTIGSGVRSIGSNAFWGCTGLQSVNIPDMSLWLRFSFGSAEENPLYYAKNLYLNGSLVTDLTIPANIAVVGDYVFNAYDKLKSLTIPSTVKSIGLGSFGNCSELREVTFEDSENPLTLADDGRRRTFAGVPVETLYLGRNVKSETFSDDLAYLKKLSVGPMVTAIKSGLFKNCTSESLKGVHITDLTAWCDIDFEDKDCNPLSKAHNLYLNGSPLEYVGIPADVLEIKPYAFYSATGIKTLTLHSGVASIGDYAFYDCSGMIVLDLPDGVQSIGSCAFYGINVSSVTIPPSVKNINPSAFNNCQSLSDVVIENSSDVLAVGGFDYGALFEDCPIKTLYVGRSLGGANGRISVSYKLKSFTVGSMATELSQIFSGGTRLETMVIEDSDSPLLISGISSSVNALSMYIGRNIETEGVNAPFSKLRLVNVEMGDKVTYIDDGLFYNCASLASVKMPETVTVIGKNAFRTCRSLVDMEIPASVTSIGEYAFSGCSSLPSVSLPSGVTNIGKEAFYGCKALQKVYAQDLQSWLAITFGNVNANPLVNGGMLYLGGALLEGGLNIPASTVSVNDYAFCNYGMISSVRLPSDIASVGSQAFYDCTGLKELTIDDGEGLLQIGRDAFTGCPIETLYLGRDLSDAAVFANRTELKALTVGSPVTAVDFTGCTGLQSVSVADASSWCGFVFDAAEANPLYYAHNLYSYPGGEPLSNLDIADGTPLIADYAFYGASGIESLTIPASVESVGESAFSGCTNLKNVTIEDGSGELRMTGNSGNGQFSDSKLETVYFGRDLDCTVQPFSGQTDITSLTIGNNITTIADNAFRGCGITEVTIPAGVVSVGDGAFRECYSLMTVNSWATLPPSAPDYTFEDITYLLGTLNVPFGASAGYRDATGWKRFANINEKFEASGVGTVTAGRLNVTVSDGRITVDGAPEGASVDVYDLSGLRVYSGTGTAVSLPGGIYIVKVAGKTFKVAL